MSSEHDFLPLVLPPYWRLVETRADGAAYKRELAGTPRLVVIVSAESHSDGKRWLHVSMSHADRLPTWETLKLVKAIFVGPHRKAIQVLPAEAEYVNIHPFVLHLYACLDGDALPDFTQGSKSL